jgi:hypothetical protein
METSAQAESVEVSRVVVELGSEAEPILVRHCVGTLPATGGTYDGYALRTMEGWVMIDPQRPTAEGAARLAKLIRERPVATVLTSDGHERFCYALREKWGTPVWGPIPGEGQRPVGYEGRPDHMYKEGGALPGGLRAIRLAGQWKGDHALWWQAPSGERVLFSGDVVNGQVEPELSHADHFRIRPGVYFGARAGYVERHANPAALKASLERLVGLELELDVIAGSHARPFRDGAAGTKAALARAVHFL